MAKPSKAKALMFQGTGSNVGKSLIVAGICRYLKRKGYKVAPFKPQNMSNNASATADGGEIGRAQALQAQAAGLSPSVDMNPVLLKPESEKGAQIIVHGKRLTSMKAAEYGNFKASLLPAIKESYERLAQQYDYIIIEGAGSPAEVNLRDGDIANMGFASAMDIPVILIGDIDRGGVMASLIGTHEILDKQDLAFIKGFIINRFRGDQSLFLDGMRRIESHTNWPSFGIVPWFDKARDFPAEDSMDLKHKYEDHAQDGKILHVIVPVLKRIANFDDLDPLTKHEGVKLSLISPEQPLPMGGDLVFIPGSKSTLQDCAAFIEAGWDIDLKAHIRQGGHVLGLCGGYQMLGQWISDPQGVEGKKGNAQQGLGLLQVTTILKGEKITRPIAGKSLLNNQPITGYEIHNGRTDGEDCTRPFAQIWGQDLTPHNDGAIAKNGRVMGSYIHGLFSEDEFRNQFLAQLGGTFSQFSYQQNIETSLDELADHLACHLDIEALMALAR